MKHAQQRLLRATLLAGLMGAGGFAMAQTSSMPAAPDWTYKTHAGPTILHRSSVSFAGRPAKLPPR